MAEKTLVQIFRNRAYAWPQKTAFRYRVGGKYKDFSWQQSWLEIEELTHGLSALGVARGERVGILSRNRPEWIYSDLALMMLGAISVPLYVNSAVEQLEYIMRDAGIRVVITEQAQLEKLFELEARLGQLEKVVIDAAEGKQPGIISFGRVKNLGCQVSVSIDRLVKESKEDAPATLVYTSGTTGQPKGAVLSQRNFVTGCRSARSVLPTREGDLALSFLPLGHVYERFVTYSNLDKGVIVAFAQSPETVVRDLVAVRPTVIFGVPRFYDRLYGRILAAVSRRSGFGRGLFWLAFGLARGRAKRLMRGERVPFFANLLYPLADLLVFSKFRKRLGGRIRFLVSGGAPLTAEVTTFFWSAGLPLFQGYGLTESCSVCSVNNFDNFNLEGVGKPCPGVEVKIASDGEILLKGGVVFQEYWRNPSATAAAKNDGWFHTGDVGWLNREGFLVITDRKKDLIVTSLGENVSPQKIESILKAGTFISEAVVFGDNRPYLTGLIWLDLDALTEYARAKGILFKRPEELVENPWVRAELKAIIAEKNQRLAPYERIRKYKLLDQDFSSLAGELTPTMKVRRKVVAKKYGAFIEAMYR